MGSKARPRRDSLQGRTVVSYVPPSRQLSEFGDEIVDQVAKMLDANLAKLTGMLGK